MKKPTLTLLALLALTLAGCVDNRTPEQKQQEINANIASHITEFNYKGHHYLLYKQARDRRGYCGMVHDPDCPCREKGESHDDD